jgi:uncharacterized repeat protein (TIGR03943 family)
MLERALKVTIMLAMGAFLFTRVTGNTILFYINDRFVILTLLAAVGFLVLAVGIWFSADLGEGAGQASALGRVSWGGLLLVSLPFLLGVLITPRPLGAAALSNREVSLESLTSVAIQERTAVPRTAERTVLDWLIEFQRADNPADLSGQEAQVIGFVYRDSRFADDTFMAGRFIVSCCVADADPIGLIVQSAEAGQFAEDQWLEIRGAFQMGTFDGQETPLLIATEINPVGPPAQPYLYP